MHQKFSDSLTCFMVYICCMIFIPFTIVIGMIFTVVFLFVSYIIVTNNTPEKPTKGLTESQKALITNGQSEKYDTIYFLLEYYETWELADWCMSVYNWNDEDALSIVEAIDLEKKLNNQPKNLKSD